MLVRRIQPATAVCFSIPLLLVAFGLPAASAQTPRALLVDGEGPWRDSRWNFAVTEFNRVLTDAGYSVTIVSPVDVPAVIQSRGSLLAVPSLESLPYDTFNAIAKYLTSGGSVMATGGQPFRTPLYLGPTGNWMDAAGYQAVVGSPPPPGFPYRAPQFETLSPGYKQYTAPSGVRIPFARARGLTATSNFDERYWAIGDLWSPAATFYLNFSWSLIVWLPWPQLPEPLRSQFVAALHAAGNRVHLMNAGPDYIVWLPGEDVTGRAIIVNPSLTSAGAVLEWSISGASQVFPQPPAPISLKSGASVAVPLDFGTLPKGEYKATFRLLIGGAEVDRIESPIRVFDPVLSRRPDQKIRVVNGSFSAGGKHVFLHGVNYQPRYIAGLETVGVNGRNWLAPEFYDPDLVETDLAQIAALNFNLVNIQYDDLNSFLSNGWLRVGRSLIDFLERCRQHGLWTRISLRASSVNAAYGDPYTFNLNLGAFLEAAFLPGNDRVFAYDLLWEPQIGTHASGGQGGYVNGVFYGKLGRLLLDADWRAWVDQQYGSLDAAEQIWGFTAPRDAKGLLTNPLDDQISTDGPWRIMVAAYRRFMEDYLGHNLGLMARQIRRTDPDALLTYRNWTTMTADHNFNSGYDIGTAASHLDFASPELYAPNLQWPDARIFGLITAYSRYRNGGKPVQWTEFGADIGPDGGTAASHAAQAAVCDTLMHEVTDDGSNAASVWWWPGGRRPDDGTDFGILNPDGTPRESALLLSQWGTSFAASPPDVNPDPPATLMVDRDADATGSYGLFLKWQDVYSQDRLSRRSVTLVDAGTGTNTATMPLLQAGNAPYSGTGPLKFANGEFAGIRVTCSALDVTVENGAVLNIPGGANCVLSATIVNTGEAQWLPGSSPAGGVAFHSTLGDVPLAAALSSLQRTSIGPLAFTMAQSPMVVSARLRIQGVGDFGETLNVTLAPDTSTCAVLLSSSAAIAAPASGLTGTIDVTTGAGCAWRSSSPETWMAVTPASGSGSATVKYTVQPNTGPARSATVQIAGYPVTVTQLPIANPPLVQPPVFSVPALNFGSQPVGSSSASQIVTLANRGAAPLTLTMVSIGGANSSDFRQSNNCGSVVGAGAVCSIQVTFAPSATGPRAAWLSAGGNIDGTVTAVSLAGAGAITGPAPTIQAVVDSWGYTAGVAPGLWVTIGGVNLAGPPQPWNLDATQKLPVTLGGVVVTFNNTPAPLLYVSANQINALVPGSISPGPVAVVVQREGLNSVPFTITAKATQPAVYAPPSSDGATFFVTAALAGTASLIGNSATDPRVVRAAHPGDTLDLYMIGLGATTDPANFITDRVFTGAFPVSAGIKATLGTHSAPVLFSGLISPGLYLVRVTVPADVEPVPQPLQITAGSAATRPNLILVLEPLPH